MGEPSPRTFGAYTVQHELGRGGMGVVYAATHEVLGKRAAVKVLQAEVSRDAELVERFFNEARAASAIDHPSIVEVYDVGRADDTVYILMELLSGESLATRLKARGALPIGTAIGIARQCANALEAAHRAGIVHRDLKPDNVFLVPDAEVAGGERVKLLDFGVAKLVGDNSSSVARTVTGAILGTPHYMSPEQCEGAREVDHRSDLYSLGCMVFQMVAGRLPFNSPGIGGLIGMHLYLEPPLLRSLRPDAPVELEALVSRLLAKVPEQRVQTATEVAALLSAIPVPTESVRVRASAPELSRVDHAMPTVASVRVNPFAATPLPTDRAAIEKAGRKRRWRWIALAALGALAALAAIVIVVIANSRTESTPYARTERIESVLPPPVPAPTPPGPTPPAPTPEPTPTDRDLAEAKQMLADRKNLDGAYARTLIVLERTPDDPEALKLEADIRRARATQAIEALRAPGRRSDEVKRSRDVVYANTEAGDALRVEADRAWAKVKPVATVPKQESQKPESKPDAKPEPKQVSKEDVKRRKADEFLHLINNAIGNPQLISLNCRSLALIAPERVPWHTCVSAACKFNVAVVDGLIAMAPIQQRTALRELCPPPGR